MITLIERYYVFTLVLIILTAALFTFGCTDDNIKMTIVGALVGLIAAPKSN